ncbi:protein bicaudal C homolog 1 [Aplochiton taeniatus]
MTAQTDSLNRYMQQQCDPSFNSERSADSPLAVSEDDSSGRGTPAPLDPEWTEDRFRVDRKKLETMLLAASEGLMNGGEDFFLKVMEETNTQIAWPSKLKIGAKSKKDPHIKVCGHRDSVREAKDRIMAVLDTKSNRVTLKMDVSHTEHSHVIGKGGNNIKKVMEETGCHIHFPDSNRNNHTDKSNQVSIAGPPVGVEEARAKIRDLLPLVLIFDLPGPFPLTPDPSSAPLQQICQTYGISVSFRQQRSLLYGASAVVRGCNYNADNVKLDIAPQHHPVITGRAGCNIKHITQTTGAQIQFPEPSGAPQRKSTVVVQGTIEAVCLARQHLMGCLPLVLMFDIREEMQLDHQGVTSLMEHLDVFISVKPKPRQPSRSVVVKSVERNCARMYEARCCLLGLPAVCSGHSVLLNTLENSLSPLHASNPNPALWPVPATNTDYGKAAGALNGHGGALNGHGSALNGHGGSLNRHGKHSGSLYSRAGCLANQVLNPGNLGNNGSRGNPVQEMNGRRLSEPGPNESRPDQGSNDAFVEVGMPRSPSHSGSSVELKQMLTSCRTSSGKRQAVELLQGTKNSHLHSESLLSDSDSTSDSSTAERRAPGSERAAASQHCTSSPRTSSSSPSPVSCTSPCTPSCPASCSTERHILTAEMEAFDYEQKKLLATKAMLKKPVVTEVRTPTNTWSGLGFSKSMPAETIKELRRAQHLPYRPSMSTTYEDSPPLSLSPSSSRELMGAGGGSDSVNWRDRRSGSVLSSILGPKRKQAGDSYLTSSSVSFLDSVSVSANTLNPSFPGCEIPELFAKLGLDKYTDTFTQQEIDLQMFLTLTDPDLKELGISTFGARRKMLLAVSELNNSGRKLLDSPSSSRSSLLEGGASGRLSRQFHADIASMSGRW